MASFCMFQHHLNIDAAWCIELNQELLKEWWRGAHSLDCYAAESSLLVAQGVLSYQPHTVQHLVGQILIHQAGCVGESLQDAIIP